MQKVFLYPGQFHASVEPLEITTLLGSCVSIVLFDPIAKVAGLNHYLLADLPSGEKPTPRYAEPAFNMLFDECVRLGAKPNQLKAKIYGGGNVISTLGGGAQTIGERNIEAAIKICQSKGISVIEKNVGGEKGRKIVLNSQTFEVTHFFNGEGASVSEVLTPSPVLKKNVRVLVVDDSATVRTLFKKIFEKNGLEVVGVATDPYEARELIASTKPDVITLDIEMPKMNGVDFLQKLMQSMPIPVVMVSSLSQSGDAALKSLEIGAVEFIHKPSQFDPTVLSKLAEQLVFKVRAAANMPVKKSIAKPASASGLSIGAGRKKDIQIIGVGGNSGSQDLIKSLISGLPEDTPPVVVACSTIAPLADGFVGSYQGKTQVKVQVGQDGMSLGLGSVTIVPSDVHATIQKTQLGYRLKLQKGDPVNSQLPSSDVLLKSIATEAGAQSCGILLSGFGNDGVEGLGAVSSAGGLTLLQEPSESLFPFGVKKAAELGYAGIVVPGQRLSSILFEQRSKRAA